MLALEMQILGLVLVYFHNENVRNFLKNIVDLMVIIVNSEFLIRVDLK